MKKQKMKRFNVTLVRSSYMTRTLAFDAPDKDTAVDLAWFAIPGSSLTGFIDHPELASYEIEKFQEIKPCKKSS